MPIRNPSRAAHLPRTQRRAPDEAGIAVAVWPSLATGNLSAREGAISMITFVLVGIIALFVLAGVVTVNDGVHGRL